MANAPVQVQAKLAKQHVVGDAQPLLFTTFLEQCQNQFVSLSAEDLPHHLDIAVAWDFNRRRRSGLPHGKAKSPPAQDVPLGDPGSCLEPDQLAPGLS